MTIQYLKKLRDKIQIKYLPSNLSVTTADITSLKFSNLVVGKVYKVTLYTSISQLGASDTLQFKVSNNGTDIVACAFSNSESQSVGAATVGVSRKFTAQNNILISSLLIIGSATLSGNGAASNSWVQLTECNNTIEADDL